MILTPLTGLSLKQWLQIGAAVLVTILVATVVMVVLHWKGEAEKVPGLKQEITRYEQTINTLTNSVRQSQAASAGFQAELERLRAARTVAPAPRPVRVCRDAPAVRPANGGTTQPGPDESPATGGVLPSEPGPDIGPELYGSADLADELSAQIRGLHQYIREVCNAQGNGT